MTKDYIKRQFSNFYNEVIKTKTAITSNRNKIYVNENLLTASTPVTLGNGWSGDFENGFTIANTTEPLTINLPTDIGKRYLISYETTSYVDWSRLSVGFADGEQNGMYSDSGQVIRICLTSNGNPIIISSAPYTITTTIKNIAVQEIDENGTELIDIPSQNYGLANNDNLVGRWNTSIGVQALEKATDVGRTVAIGFKALCNMAVGNINIAIGSYALERLTKGQGNIVIGVDGMQIVTESYYNIAIGQSACSYFGEGDSNNIGIGVRAFGNKADVNTDNIGIGYYAMGGTEESGNTVAIGTQAGFHMKQNGVAIGYKAGYYKCGNNNIAIGNNSIIGGTNDTTEVTNAVCLGANAKAQKTNSVAIGYGSVASKENQTVIGNASTTETRVFGDLIVKGTDGIPRQIVFNQDGTCSWVTPS